MNSNIETLDLPEDAARQYIDARQTFLAFEQAQTKLKEYRGGMIWRTQKGRDYLVRTSARGAQTGLGARGPQTEAIFEKFTTAKVRAEEMEKHLRDTLERHRRMNKALRVGRTPDILIDILNGLKKAGLDDKFLVVGTNALYAYETAASARVEAGQLATKDFDLLWDNRRKLRLAVQEGPLADGMLGFLRRIDASFTLRDDQKYTAVNKQGYEVDILRRMGAGSDAEPARISTLEDDFWAVKARNADWLLSAPKFSDIVVGTNGRMARMITIDPRAFALFKLWMAEQKDREYAKRVRDASQAKVVIKLINERLPQFSFEALKTFPADVADMITSDENGARLAERPTQSNKDRP
jgi:hypothetical protein